MTRRARDLWQDKQGAVAPTVALSLIGLIAAGGIAFDYARMAGLDSELQNAADQAALAAATQLDNKIGTCARASAAAVAFVSNQTLFANESTSTSTAVTITPEPTCDATGFIKFYQDKAKTQAATADANANFVEVTVNSRTANFALTPIVAAISSGQMFATAYAGVGSAVCKVPPLMMCNPAETSASSAFPVGDYVGRGIRLVAGGSGGGWGPGNFGYLETNLGPGANALEYALGANIPPGDCVSAETITTKPGLTASVTDAINTRFDIYDNGLVNACTTSTCAPALNTRKDLVHKTLGSAASGQGEGIGCGIKNNEWELPPAASRYLPISTTNRGARPTNMGHPRDVCHSVDPMVCPAGRIGNGTWDRDLYFDVNHGMSTAQWQAAMQAWINTAGTQPTTTDVTKISRYDVYRWEIANASAALGGRLNPGAENSGSRSYSAPVCGTGVGASASQPDRRLATVAVVNCIASGISGSSQLTSVAKWIDVFLVEPSVNRDNTAASDIYVEVVREANANSSGNIQVVRRDVPYLIE